MGQVVEERQAQIGLAVLQQVHIVVAGVGIQQSVVDARAPGQQVEQLDRDACPVAFLVFVGVGVAVGVDGYRPHLAACVGIVQVGLLLRGQGQRGAAAGAGVPLVQVDLPGGFLPVHLCQGAVQQGQCLGVALAHCHIKRCFIEGFQHPFIGGNAVGVGQCRGDFPFVQGLGQLIVRVVKHRGIGKVMVGGKLNKALVAAVAVVGEAHRHAVVGAVLPGNDGAVAGTHRQHAGDGAHRAGGKIKSILAVRRDAQVGDHVDLAVLQHLHHVVHVAVVTVVFVDNVAIPRNFLQQLIAVAAVAAVSVDHIKAGVGIVTHPQLLGRGNLLSLRMQAKGRGEEQAAQQQQRRRQGQDPVQKAGTFCSIHHGNTPDREEWPPLGGGSREAGEERA